MLDLSHFPEGNGVADVQEFFGQGASVGQAYHTWLKPRGKSMCSLLLLGKGGRGGSGVIGAASTAGGGGGGGSGGMTSLTMPLLLLPDALYLSLAGWSSTNTLASTVSIFPSLAAGGGAPVPNNVLMIANGGSNGGNASGGTGGSAGSGGSAASASTMPIGWQWANLALAGQSGGAGGTNANGSSITIPVTGMIATGGAGGGALAAAATLGFNGGGITGGGLFPTRTGGVGSSVATTPPGQGLDGSPPVPNLLYGYGGMGGGATYGSATGAGLVQARGGHGMIGCGGGGMGGALTGSTAAVVSEGGVAYCLIVCW